ncbi:MAG: RNA methyltransferase [Nitrososphaeria archaeon]
MVETVVAMIEPESQGNIGAVARSMKNFGLSQLYLINPKEKIGADSRKMAAHAQEILDNAKILMNLEELRDECDLIYGTTAISARRPTNVKRNTISPSEFARVASSIDGRIAVLLGRESNGLSNMELEQCDAVISIPASKQYSTLNVAMAGGIIFYEMFKAYERTHTFPLIDRPTKENLLDEFKSILSRTNLPEYKKHMIQQAFKNIVGKSAITKKEAGLLLTAFRRIRIELQKRNECIW